MCIRLDVLPYRSSQQFSSTAYRSVAGLVVLKQVEICCSMSLWMGQQQKVLSCIRLPCKNCACDTSALRMHAFQPQPCSRPFIHYQSPDAVAKVKLSCSHGQYHHFALTSMQHQNPCADHDRKCDEPTASACCYMLS